jgi:hypothetical protein
VTATRSSSILSAGSRYAARGTATAAGLRRSTLEVWAKTLASAAR